MIRAVIFDCFGVLYSGSLGYLQSIAPPEHRNEIAELNSQKDYGYITFDDFLVQASALIGVSKEHLIEAVKQRHIRNSPMFEEIPALKASVKVGLLSNIGDSQFEELFSTEDAGIFDEIFLSYQEGIAKPNPEAFREMAMRMGVKPDECVMVDDMMHNCEGAEVAGMTSILHTNNELTAKKLADLITKNNG